MSFSSLGVFCGSGTGNVPDYMADAYLLGKISAQKGIRLVYGASGEGLMGAMADACVRVGGKVLGLSDTELASFEKKQVPATTLRIFDNLNDRKQALFDESDAFCVLPGGLGTLDELANILVLKQIQKTDKPVVLYNGCGFWTPFRQLIDTWIQKGFVRQKDSTLFQIVDTVEEVFSVIERELSNKK